MKRRSFLQFVAGVVAVSAIPLNTVRKHAAQVAQKHFGSTFYVDFNGSDACDSNSGITPDCAFKTFPRAISEAQGGDVVYCRGISESTSGIPRIPELQISQQRRGGHFVDKGRNFFTKVVGVNSDWSDMGGTKYSINGGTYG